MSYLASGVGAGQTVAKWEALPEEICSGTAFSVEIFSPISLMRQTTLVTPNPEEDAPAQIWQEGDSHLTR